MKRSRSSGSRPRPLAATPAESIHSTSAIEGRRTAIEATRKEEKAALAEYEKALEATQRCDPLTVGYAECQAQLRRASEALINAREAHQRAMSGMQPKPDAP